MSSKAKKTRKEVVSSDDDEVIVVPNEPKRKLATNVTKQKKKAVEIISSTEFDTDWDIDYYKVDYESEDHWNLRRQFMETHKKSFSEDELVCLAQVFCNVEFMGCRYPSETMQRVAELSEEVAREFREKRASKLKRTFVAASDAAEQRAKGRRKQN